MIKKYYRCPWCEETHEILSEHNRCFCVKCGKRTSDCFTEDKKGWDNDDKKDILLILFVFGLIVSAIVGCGFVAYKLDDKRIASEKQEHVSKVDGLPGAWKDIYRNAESSKEKVNVPHSVYPTVKFLIQKNKEKLKGTVLTPKDAEMLSSLTLNADDKGKIFAELLEYMEVGK